MSDKDLTIASILKIWIWFDSKNLKLDHDMKNNLSESLSIKLLTLKQSASFWSWRKSVMNKVLIINELDAWKLK